VTLSGYAAWPKVADTVIEADMTMDAQQVDDGWTLILDEDESQRYPAKWVERAWAGIQAVREIKHRHLRGRIALCDADGVELRYWTFQP
jgi:hypothetical protein